MGFFQVKFQRSPKYHHYRENNEKTQKVKWFIIFMLQKINLNSEMLVLKSKKFILILELIID
jgi:hypothetical protein